MKKQIVCPVCAGRGFVSWLNTAEDTCSTGSKTCPHCNGSGLREIDMTNADHIRSMTDEELADFLVDLADDGNLLIREWLKEPYKEA